MGTNFYVRGHRDSYGGHIGKRSAAGPYCWDCGCTLHSGGESKIHYSAYDDGWLDACPKCGKERQEESLGVSSAGREIGFDKSVPHKKTGVASCCSFSWAVSPERFKEFVGQGWNGTCPSCGGSVEDPDKVIEDEYGTLFTVEEFEQVLEECPVQYTDSVGVEFS